VTIRIELIKPLKPAPQSHRVPSRPAIGPVEQEPDPTGVFRRHLRVQQRLDGASHLLPVAVESNEPNARGAALIDSVLQAGRTVGVGPDRTRAGPQTIDLLNELYGVLGNPATAKRADVLGTRPASAADDPEAREGSRPVDLDVPAP